MRSDAIGLFWQDTPRERGSRMARVMPPIPDTGWEAPKVFPNLRAAKALSIDVETYDPELKKHGPGWARGKGHICGLAVGTDDGGRWYFPMRHTIEKDHNLDPDHVLAWARDTLCDPSQPKVGANITYDVGWLREEGIRVKGPLYDVQFAEALLDERASVNLDDLGTRYLGEHKTSSLLYEWCSQYYGGRPTEDQRKNIYRAPPRLVGPYAQGDVDLPFRVMEKQWPLLLAQGLMDVFIMECELIPLMIEMRYAGVTVDIGRAERLREQMEDELADIDRQLAVMLGFEVNTNAAESLARAFDSLGIRYGHTEKGAPSFRASFLESVQHPVAQLILKKKKREKLKGTFIEGYILDSHVNGKLYGQFHQLRGDRSGARSGRFSSSNPNLQNIPVRSKLGKEMRKCFVPDLGHLRWRKHDYSQIEYRALAHYAVGLGSDEVRAQYQRDPRTDYHKMMHGLILDRTGKNLERGEVKNTNFGVVYGMGVAALARRLGLSKSAGRAFLETYHEGAPFVRPTMDATMTEAQKLGYITTLMGRRSRFDLWVPGKYDEDAKPLPYELAVLRYPNPQRAYLHKALNRRLQGTAADLIKMAMLKCWKGGIFDVTGVPRLTVHDELDFSDPGDCDDAFAEMIHIMETALPMSVPVMVGDERGPNWGDVEEYDQAA